MRSDDELYSLFRAGDGTAFDELMLRYGDDLLIYLNGYTHNLHDAEDLMIEAFARIMVKRPAIREGNFKAYLFRTGRNLASRFHRRSRRADIFSMDDLQNEIADGNLPDEIVCKADLVVKVLVNIHLAYIVEEIEVEIVDSALLELFLEDLFDAVKARQVITRELGGEIERVAVVL